MNDMIAKLKAELLVTEKELEMLESKFKKKVKKKNRRYSPEYVEKVVKSAFLYGQLEVWKKFQDDDSKPNEVDYIG